MDTNTSFNEECDIECEYLELDVDVDDSQENHDHHETAYIERLILEVESHRCLYDKSHENYKNKKKKDEIWKEISQILSKNGKKIH